MSAKTKWGRLILPFELMYMSKAGHRSYWTIDHHFSKSKDNHYDWDSNLDVITEFYKLYDQYPTIYHSKNLERFYVSESGTNKLRSLQEGQSLLKHSQQNVSLENDNWPKLLSKTMLKKIKKDKKYYAVALKKNYTLCFLDTTLNKIGGFVSEFTSTVRRWDEASKAIATAEMVLTNSRFWKRYPSLDPHDLIVIDARTGTTMWPSNQDDQPIVIDEFLLCQKIEKLSRQMCTHFEPSFRENFDISKQVSRPPQLDSVRYNAAAFFNALTYVLQCLLRSKEINQLLEWYDTKVIQDQLHTIELSDINRIKAADFLAYIQESRQKRRQVKDLAVLVNTVARNIKVDKIINELSIAPSLSNKYHYRDPETAGHLRKLINPAKENGQSSCPPSDYDADRNGLLLENSSTD